MEFFEYTQAEVDALCKKDKQLGEHIVKIGMIEREVIPDVFSALVNSIIGQQISTKAQVTIWRRMCNAIDTITPEAIYSLSEEEIQSFGLTMKKAGYIRRIAEKIVCGELNLAELYELPDDEVCRRLSSLDGIGVWTAEMLMMFSMQRRDIFSFGDLAIHRGLRMVYRHEKVSRELFEKYRRRYSPHCSVASLYLWRIAAGEYGLTDPAPGKKSITAKSGKQISK